MIDGIIRLPDGTYEIVRDADEFAQIVRERLGDDAEGMVRKLIENSDVAAHLAKTDFEAYESELESVRFGLVDLREMIGELRGEVDKPRINKAMVRALIDRMGAELSNHI